MSMGLGLINAACQARFSCYLADRWIADTTEARVWCFAGDGQMDELDSLTAAAMGGREQVYNLVFVVNCDLQRLDGPVRGDATVIQELEALFRGAGWNVVDVMGGRGWDPLLAADVDGVLVGKMNRTVDGQYRNSPLTTAPLSDRYSTAQPTGSEGPTWCAAHRTRSAPC